MQYECEYQRKGIYTLCFPALPTQSKAKLSDSWEGSGRQIRKFTTDPEGFQKSLRGQNVHILLKISLGAYLHLQILKRLV